MNVELEINKLNSGNQLRAFQFTEEIMDNQGKDSPIKNETDTNKRRWWIVFQKINLRQSQRPYQNNFDGQDNCGYGALPGDW